REVSVRVSCCRGRLCRAFPPLVPLCVDSALSPFPSVACFVGVTPTAGLSAERRGLGAARLPVRGLPDVARRPRRALCRGPPAVSAPVGSEERHRRPAG